jgi:transcriptional regulator of acetoin/glycerol metabolism
VKATLELSQASQHAASACVPGLVLVTRAGAPAYEALPLPSEGAVLGRGTPATWLELDERVSRNHVRVRRVAGCWVVEDAGSRNGTFVDGQPLRASHTSADDLLIGLGHSLVWAVADVQPFLDGARTGPDADGQVFGGRMRAALRELALAAASGHTVFVRGASGTGKELAARAYHRAAHAERPRAPFVAVNCATIPQALAEGLLFGAKRGAYSGATHDTEGYLASADGGTLFLDELAELDLAVQAKLLRVLETREVVPLGATQGRSVRFHLCAATLRDLQAEVAAGRFRDDLYYRLGRPEVLLPPLSARVDELPWLIAEAARKVAPSLRVSHAFVEACATRPWPGNVRELLSEVGRACFAARHAGADSVRPSHLAKGAGQSLHGPDAAAAEPPGAAPPPDDAAIAAALVAEDGNVSRAARALGMHRNQLRRWLARRADPG